MKVQINSFPVGFELENEKTIADVIGSMYKWTQERDLVFVEAQIDDKNYLINDIPELSLDEVELINCQVQSKADIVISSLSECINYCNKALNFIVKTKNSNQLDQSQIESMCDGIDWLIEVMNRIMQLLSLDINEIKYQDKRVIDYVHSIEIFKNNIVNSNNDFEIIEYFSEGGDIFNSISNIFKMLYFSENLKSLVIKSIESPDVLINSLMGIRNDVSDQLTNLEEIAHSFQAGKDNLGSEKLQVFIDFIYRYIKTCHQISPVFGIDLKSLEVDNISLDEKNANINNLLNDIIEALENNDIISLSDILEYEMKPSLEDLHLYIDQLINLIK
ncbi:MAG: hypothetical protein SVZ03_03415 [Spirochaetota bacterium]|nr:hypothetical protein [Spirochaetota bacterium]